MMNPQFGMDLNFACHKMLLNTINECLVKVEQLCSEIGLPYAEYEKQSDLSFRKILRKTLDFDKEMANFKRQLNCDIEKNTMKVNSLCEQLKLDAKLFLLADIKEFKEQQNLFRTLIGMIKKRNLDDGEQYLAEVVPEDISNLPMDHIKQSIKKMEELKDSNKKKSTDLISSIRNVLQVLRMSVDTEPLANISPDDQVLYQVDMVTKLQTKLDYYLSLKKSHIKASLEDLRMEIERIWNECHFSDEYKLSCKKLLTGSMDDEDNLSQLEEYLFKLKQVATKLSAIDEKIAIHKSQLQELEEVEVRLNDPDKFLNRGGRLLKDETLKKKLLHSLPKIEAEITSEIESLKESVDLSLRNDLESFSEQCVERWKLFHDKKNLEIQVRHKNKIESLNHDLRYGSKPAPAPKKHVAGYASKTTDDTKKRVIKIPIQTEKPTLFIVERQFPEESVLCFPKKQKNRPQDPATSTPINHPSKRFKPSED